MAGFSGPPLIGVLSNPASGGNRRHLPAIRKLLETRRGIIHREATTPAEINAALDELRQRRPAYLVLNGGDGTIQAVLTRFLHREDPPPPPLVILKAGTTSMTAGDIGLKGRAPAALENFLTKAAAGSPLPTINRRVLRVRAGSGPLLGGMFFGAGGIPQGIRYFHRKVNRRGIRGELGPALVVARAFLALAGRRQQLFTLPTSGGRIDCQPLPAQKYLLLLATTLERLFFGWHPFWDEKEGPLHFTAVREQPRYFFRLLPRLARGKAAPPATPANGYFSRNAATIVLTGVEQFTIDGQLFAPGQPADRITITTSPPFRFVRLGKRQQTAAIPVRGCSSRGVPEPGRPAPAAVSFPEKAGPAEGHRQLAAFIAGHHPQTTSPATAALVAILRQKYGPALQAILFYGSCLRKKDHFAGLLDLYLIVDRYRHAYDSRLLAVGNYLLPPNVFYLETSVAGRTVRAKYAVLTLADLKRGSRHWFHPYLWGRFSQPVSRLYCRSATVARQLDEALAQAILTLVTATLPCLPPTFTAAELWSTGLERSYGTELRPERPGQGQRLYLAARDYYDQAAAIALPATLFPVTANPDRPGSYRARIPDGYRRRADRRWRQRQILGKTFTVLRLLKAFFTFKGGISYLSWKIERHSGIRLAPPPGRQHNLFTFLRALWRGWRRGAFR